MTVYRTFSQASAGAAQPRSPQRARHATIPSPLGHYRFSPSPQHYGFGVTQDPTGAPMAPLVNLGQSQLQRLAQMLASGQVDLGDEDAPYPHSHTSNQYQDVGPENLFGTAPRAVPMPPPPFLFGFSQPQPDSPAPQARPLPTTTAGPRRAAPRTNQPAAANARPLNTIHPALNQEQFEPLPEAVLADLSANPLISRDFIAGFVAPEASIMSRPEVTAQNMSLYASFAPICFPLSFC